MSAEGRECESVGAQQCREERYAFVKEVNMRRHFLAAYLTAAVAAAAVCERAWATAYEIGTEGHVSIGCFGPCACPVFPGGSLSGSFELTPAASVGPFDWYDVTNVSWLANVGDLDLSFVGQGTYRVGGEMGLEQQLVLDLRVNGGPPRRYDSGIVAGGWDFPAIDVGLPFHDYACWDSVLVVRAAPGSLGVDAREVVASALSARPNPFRQAIDISYSLSRSGTSTLRIHDVAGRLVRTLYRNRWRERGPHTVAWDGLSDGGAELPAGVYFARLEAGTERSTLRVVRHR